MHQFFLLLSLILCLCPFQNLKSQVHNGAKGAFQPPDYFQYHEEVVSAEKLIVLEKFDEALQAYDRVFSEYEFVFLSEYRIATQLALFLGEDQKAFDYLQEAIRAGWELKAIKKNDFLKELREKPQWRHIEREYPLLRAQYESAIDQELRARVQKMYSRDQKKAMGALLKLSSKGQDKYAENKFAPHSEIQMAELKEILALYGYPGEQLIGNEYWMSTILSHHNSISEDYAKQDTLYPALKPELMLALKEGQISPFELALIDDWYQTVLGTDQNMSYGILNSPLKVNVPRSNSLRKSVCLRPIELRNGLVEIQEKTGMDFYLPGNPWIEGKIEIK